ncbi:uncharacterized protein MONOS_9188 [Monocercomonoides exilis]|uniref:uncharacterized protein n=1 Tax=Monocercomonoides exilis TaxID=2049356 RepID=UPI00355A9AB6|nr:hypothetical protein MONOS_9188 [Monocercomonoides exilis]|eukprot:MONOS_9188.1-p1 / transcript=MONOS_9188.1 / gene=MONOS_9188 / organism=Monocercomonoides_exilis_PA203 / gene_product=unspecified product / transcript_product=unspecified product / location=Mono_scaffold00370:44312-44861(+) / protein_length=166 / sequence_SO=supercontig / SO=protein_coding / is_pseudo=false
MERKKKTRTQLAQKAAEKPDSTFQKTQQSQAALCRSTQTHLRIAAVNEFVNASSSSSSSSASLPSQTGYANINYNGGGCNGGGVDDFGIIILFGRKYRQKTGLETLFARSMQQIGQKECTSLLHSLGKALSHLFNQLGSPQLPKPSSIPSSHAGKTGGILENDAN